MAYRPEILSRDELRAIRRSRRHPRMTQTDYLHLRKLVEGLRAALLEVPPPTNDILDIWCGSRPYEDMFPAGAKVVGFDTSDNPYSIADVASDTFLPFPDASFDLVVFIQAFQYVPDPARAVAEIARVLRPGGTALVTLVFAFEYDRRISFEGRYTEQQLRGLFSDWANVEVHEHGGRSVAWTGMTTGILSAIEQRTARIRPLRMLHPIFAAAYAGLNILGLALAWGEERGSGNAALPMNLTLTARIPSSG